MAEPAYDLSVVIAATKAGPLSLTLASLSLRGDEAGLDVIVCDSGPPGDGAVRRAALRAAALPVPHMRVRHYRVDGRAAGRARNWGILRAKAARVLIVDDDCLVPAGLLRLHRAAGRDVGLVGFRDHLPGAVWANAPEMLITGADRGVVVGALLEAEARPEMRLREGSDVLARMHRHCRERDPLIARQVFTCHVSYPAEALRAVGGFWEEMRGSGAEDGELALRLHRHGVRHRVLEAPLVRHLDHPQCARQAAALADNRALYRQTERDVRAVVRNGGPLPFIEDD